MWISFAMCLIVTFLLLYLPGGILLFQRRAVGIGSICFYPVISIALYSVIELLLISVDIAASFPLLMGITCGILIISVTIRNIHQGRNVPSSCNGSNLKSSCSSDWAICLYVAIGCVAVFLFFIKQLDGPDSFFQGWDNVTHLNAIRAFINSGDWNPLSLDRYEFGDISPYIESGPQFYPSALHVLCAAVASVTGAVPAVALNAINAVMIGLVFPLGFYQLISTLSNRNLAVVLAGSLLCLGNAVAPWDMLIYGPLFPNLFAFSFIPAVMSSFILMCRDLTNSLWSNALHNGLIVLLGALVVFLGHPNGIFSLIVLLAPYLLHWGLRELTDRGFSVLHRRVLVVAYLLFIACFWVVCYNLPMFSSVVGVSWPAICDSFVGAAVDALMFSYVFRPENIVVSILMIVGIFSIARNCKFRWLLGSMLAAQFLYAICAGTDGEMKQILTGFWYTDYYRLAALAAFAASIVACFGLGRIFEWSSGRINDLAPWNGENQFKHFQVRHLLPVATFLLAGYLSFNGNIVLPVVGHIELPLGYQAAETERQYNKALIHYDVLTVGELNFVNENRDLLSDGSTIINSPNDGSLFLYATDNMNTYYRSGSCPGPNEETEDSFLIRTRLFDIDNDERVKNAVKNIGAKYVLQLDYGDREEECRIFYNSYNPEDWQGIQLINENTPGFTLLSETHDMRIFRIDDL